MDLRHPMKRWTNIKHKNTKVGLAATPHTMVKTVVKVMATNSRSKI
jgi:hypothetical protein